MAASKQGDKTVFRSGPFIGVRETTEPTDDQPNQLTGAANMYVPDPVNASSAYGRPGATVAAAALNGGAVGQEVFRFVATNGTVTNFTFVGGKLYRQPTDLTTAPTDVTPANVAINTTGFIYCEAFNNTLIVNDGTNHPWYGTNLNAGTPITATKIAYDSGASLTIGTTDTKIGYSAWTYEILGVSHSLAASPGGINVTAVGTTGNITANQWFAYTFQINAAGTITITPYINITGGYATEALALAPAAATQISTSTLSYMGTVTVQAQVGAVWIPQTDAFAQGSSGNEAQTTNYYQGEGSVWSAFGKPEVYGGTLFFIGNSLNGVSSRTTILWSEVGDQTLGYFQDNFDNTWELTQTGTDPIYVLKGTNVALYYSRDLSWGALQGYPGVNFRNTATHDVVSYNIGCRAPKTVHLFGDILYFSDMLGRPNRFRIGGVPEDIWKQMRSPAEANVILAGTTPSAITSHTWAAIEPNLNLYIAAAWPQTVGNLSPTKLYVFDALSGRYSGTWDIGAFQEMDVGGLMLDSNNQPALMMVGKKAAGTTGWLWKLTRVNENTWQDNATDIVQNAKVQRFGYSGTRLWTATGARAMTLSTQAMTLATLTTNAATSFTAQTPSASADGIGRAYWKFGDSIAGAVVGRSVQVTLTPTVTTQQWKLVMLEVDAIDGGEAPPDEL